MIVANLHLQGSGAGLFDLYFSDYYLSKFFREIMHDPQLAADGFTYEGEALCEWLENGRETSPMTNVKVCHLHLTPNHALRLAVQDWLCKS
ncbi:U-box domain-containing protein 33-like [Tripterygium wilfordii]|uniref:U-box domain-containing protein 33-like n=1 Tax=Tripterygium wilfordii TaxID=458696 RepID=A0A7J7DYI8_TRIWF|nr:U-box domain-containing protein 33-like [Tripterygium wilfordii]